MAPRVEKIGKSGEEQSYRSQLAVTAEQFWCFHLSDLCWLRCKRLHAACSEESFIFVFLSHLSFIFYPSNYIKNLTVLIRFVYNRYIQCSDTVAPVGFESIVVYYWYLDNASDFCWIQTLPSLFTSYSMLGLLDLQAFSHLLGHLFVFLNVLMAQFYPLTLFYWPFDWKMLQRPAFGPNKDFRSAQQIFSLIQARFRSSDKKIRSFVLRCTTS